MNRTQVSVMELINPEKQAGRPDHWATGFTTTYLKVQLGKEAELQAKPR